MIVFSADQNGLQSTDRKAEHDMTNMYLLANVSYVKLYFTYFDRIIYQYFF
jgi:hypothetical protein